MEKTPREKLMEAKINRAYWYGRARIDAASFSRTLKKVAEEEEKYAKAEEEYLESKLSKLNKKSKENTEFPQT